MIRDPFYRQIIDRLQGPLDPVAFQACANDLLRAIYPTLVPMVGGTDSGMDGATANLDGALFLVCTISPDVIGNLTGSLKSHLKDRMPRRNVILATSQQLTTKRKTNLGNRASKLGFTLIQIHDQAALAGLLYRNTKWCKELLNLTGDPPPLSVIPLTERPLLSNVLIGREADLTWLSQTSGDRLLVGQPGSGKTFILREFAREGRGLFVISNDRGAIATGIREQRPSVIIVDDVRGQRELLRNLKQLRTELGAEFAILVTCWPSEQESIAAALNLPEERIRRLELLTRDQIVEVINTSGLHGPNRLVREIVDQAEGRPGLAVTLASLCLQGGISQVALGDALSGSLMTAFEAMVGQDARDILAAFAVGGDSGMSMIAVAKTLELPAINVHRLVKSLDACGVIVEVQHHCLSVRPPTLRYPLVRDTFFKGALSLPIEPLMAQAPDKSDVALTLIGAKARRADISSQLLIGALEQADSDRAWTEYAALGSNEARWVNERYPEKLIRIVWPALHWIPEIVIPQLLTASIGDNRPLHSTTEHPMRIIQDWIAAAPRGTGEVLRRRKLLLKCACDWSTRGGDHAVTFKAIEQSLSPGFQDVTTDPGLGIRVTLTSGVILLDEMLAVQALWPDARAAIQTLDISDWMPLRGMVAAWAYPEPPDAVIPSDMRHAMEAFATTLLQDLVVLANGNAGILHWANELAIRLRLEVTIPIDPEFEILYPGGDHGDWHAAQIGQKMAAIDLASRWNGSDLTQIIEKINRMEQEAASARITWPRWTPFVCEQIVQQTESLGRWTQSIIAADTRGDLVLPFLLKAARVRESGWVGMVSQCLDDKNLQWVALSVVFSTTDPPEDLIARAMSRLEGYAGLVETLCMRNEVPEHLVHRLLRHSDPAIAAAAAKGEWWADPHETIRDSLRNDWRIAVINHVDGDHWLVEVFRRDSVLARDWLQRRLSDGRLKLFRNDETFQAATSALDVEARRHLLPSIPNTFGVEPLIVWLVDGYLDLFRELLKDNRLKNFHLAPLGGELDATWIEKAKIALDAGYGYDQVAGAAYTYPRISFWIGDESAMWSGWVDRFESLQSNDDGRIRRIGEIGKAHAKSNRDRALLGERREAIYGID
jgi:hypothetical protein